MNLIKIGNKVINLDNATEIDLEAVNLGSRTTTVKVEYNVPTTDSSGDGYPYYSEFYGEEAATLRAYLLEQAEDVQGDKYTHPDKEYRHHLRTGGTMTYEAYQEFKTKYFRTVAEEEKLGLPF